MTTALPGGYISKTALQTWLYSQAPFRRPAEQTYPSVVSLMSPILGQHQRALNARPNGTRVLAVRVIPRRPAQRGF